ncbi:winged helix-turn-helix domain-containing tetratricopeptide repeat protein [Sinorhizobium arboris]|uniref:winged helix-turn-helix domain-containing tetratricopeptide repeat protein n=1 Tax=Sinorhizobium arboris TaxID=76745 RepID=UPI000407A8E9|nr:tetratricopeptide repeat protein [Sinorhizobium arboris]
MASQRFSFGPFLLDTGRDALFEYGVPVPLGSKPLALLRALAEARGQVVAKSALMEAAWPNTYVEESNLTVQIAALRKRLQVAPGDEEWIATFPRVGYRFAGPLVVEECETATNDRLPDFEPEVSNSRCERVAIRSPEPVSMHGEPAVARHTTARTATRWWQRRAIVGAILVLVLFAVAGATGWLRPWAPTFESRLPLPDKPSIAVLPFANLTRDRADGYFTDGIVDDLITDLSRVSGLFVIARNSAFAYRDKPIEIRDVAQELGVRYVLQGSIQRAGSRVRINVHLVDATTAGQLWAERYDASLGNIFALQDEITGAIVDALALRLTDAERNALHEAETSVPDAYDAFLRGWEHYRRTTPEDYAAAVPYFEHAIELDPSYGRAYAALALVYVQTANALWSYRLGIPVRESQARAQLYFLEAQKRPTALAHQVAAMLLQMDWKHAPALDEIQKAIALDPGEPWNYAVMSWILTSSGRSREAVAHIRTAMRLEPHSPPYFFFVLGLAQFSNGDYAEASTSLEKVIGLSPDAECLLLLAAAYAHLGRLEDAAAALSRFNDSRLRRGDVAITIASMPSFDYSTFADRERLKEGLALAGVPKSLESEEHAKNRLSAGAVRELLLGHRLHGRTLATGEEHAASITADGTATLSGDWGSVTNGKVEIDDAAVCYVWSGGVRFCGTVVHNPGGTRAAENELIWIDARGAFAFSQVE